MPKYKSLDEGLIDKFIDKVFGGVAKSQAKNHIKKITTNGRRHEKISKIITKRRIWWFYETMGRVVILSF